MSIMQHTQIVSSIPGRTRFKLPTHKPDPQEMAKIANNLQAHPDVHNVEYNAKTGSILVHHDSHESSLENIKDIMQDLCVVFADITGASELIPLEGKSENGGSDLTSVLCDFNERVVNATNGVIDLRFVLPLGIGALGVLQFLTYGWQFEIIPWYVLIYFAIDSFIKLNFDPAQAV